MPALSAVVFDAKDPVCLARFWGGVLGREVAEEAGGAFLPGSDTQVALRFVPSRAERVGPNLMHLHLTSDSPARQDETVASALELGARHLDVGQLPEEKHVVLADPEGNEFCVIEPGSSFLSGCGFLGEVGCDGTRACGRFWSEALGWPLVWDQDEETAVQSPHGGTKIAWGGPPLAPKPGRSRQRLELGVTDAQAETDRLLSLGAGWLEPGDDGVVALADPDGNELILRVT